jgi:hydrogenase expression/formation protein HypC
MCVALPGKIEKIEDNIATVNFSGNVVRAHTGVVDVQVGDFVLVHAGLVIQKLDQEEAENMTELFEAIKEIENGQI